jgi:hypothetical protein
MEGFPKPAGRIQQRCTRFFMLSCFRNPTLVGVERAAKRQLV